MTPTQYRFHLLALSAPLLCAGAWAQPAVGDADADATQAAYPAVITPTRLRQSLADVPAAVTVITRDTLRAYGIRSIPEALRLVPGMAVTRATGNDYRINYHGTDVMAPRRLNVLIDGVSAYQAMISDVEWTLLPVALEDVDRIEVTRGPDSAAYGPNSMTAVVNILTRHAGDVEQAMVSISRGSRGVVDTTARAAGTWGATQVRATVNYQEDDGHDHVGAENLAANDHDSLLAKRFNLKAHTALGPGGTLELQAAHVEGRQGSAIVLDPFQDSPLDQRRRQSQVSARWTQAWSADHELQVQVSSSHTRHRQAYRSCPPGIGYLPEMHALFRSNPSYVFQLMLLQFPTGGSARDDELLAEALAAWDANADILLMPFCGSITGDHTETRTQVELQDTLVISPGVRVVSGLGLRHQRADSAMYFGRPVRNDVSWVFGHAELRPAAAVTLNVGGYAEHNSLSGATFSPRVGLNVHLTPNQTLRASVSKGTRSPDLFEERGDYNIAVRDLDTPVLGSTSGRLFVTGRAKGGMRSERIVSRELGYLLALPARGLTFDARLFDDHLTRLVFDSWDNDNPIVFNTENRDSVRLSGVEAQAQWEFHPRWSAFMSYARLLNRDPTHPSQAMQYAKHSGALGVSHTINDAWRAALAYYGYSGNGLQEQRQGRTDLRLAYAFKAAAGWGEAAVVLSYLDNRRTTTPLGTLSYFSAEYDRCLSAVATLRLAF